MGTLQRQTTLSKQASAVFNLTLDQLQQSVGSGKPFGSMNMVSALARDASWDHMHGASMLLGVPLALLWGQCGAGDAVLHSASLSVMVESVVGLRGKTEGSLHGLDTGVFDVVYCSGVSRQALAPRPSSRLTVAMADHPDSLIYCLIKEQRYIFTALFHC